MDYQCKKCRLTFDSSVLSRCPGCNTQVGDSGKIPDPMPTPSTGNPSPQPERVPAQPVADTSDTQVGAKANGFIFTGTQWLPIPTPNLATAYFVRAIALIIFANLIAVAGGVVVVAFGEDGLGFFVVTAVIALILVLVAATSYFQGNTRLSEYERFTVRPNT